MVLAFIGHFAVTHFQRNSKNAAFVPTMLGNTGCLLGDTLSWEMFATGPGVPQRSPSVLWRPSFSHFAVIESLPVAGARSDFLPARYWKALARANKLWKWGVKIDSLARSCCCFSRCCACVCRERCLCAGRTHPACLFTALHFIIRWRARWKMGERANF